MTTLEDILNPFDYSKYMNTYFGEKDYIERKDNIVFPYQICYNSDRIRKTKIIYGREGGKTINIKCPVSIQENLKIKHYIKIGEECSICNEHIWSKSNAFLSDCGHCFHKTCIHKWLKTTYLNGRCPLCRSDLGECYFAERYYSLNKLDLLENFIQCSDIMMPIPCIYNNSDMNFTHFVGERKWCEECYNFRHHIGCFTYELF
jgi:hypothetical protein